MENFTEDDVSFMREAISEARKALDDCEVPVGCVFVNKTQKDAPSKIVGRGFNKTNLTKNVKYFSRATDLYDYDYWYFLKGTMHAELVAINSMLNDQQYDPSFSKLRIVCVSTWYLTWIPSDIFTINTSIDMWRANLV